MGKYHYDSMVRGGSTIDVQRSGGIPGTPSQRSIGSQVFRIGWGDKYLDKYQWHTALKCLRNNVAPHICLFNSISYQSLCLVNVILSKDIKDSGIIGKIQSLKDFFR
jgi:hypothetical protein